MCGIAGIVSPRPLNSVQATDEIASMVTAIAHRGPDDRGSWVGKHAALGHARLSIIDLSHAGHQPMCDDSGRVRLIFNGEIYNYRELRSELTGRGHRFRTATDTEVLLRSYLEYGPSCLKRLNGMWAFAIWDDKRQTLFAARDRAGKKPFFYVHRHGVFYFASEVKAFLELGMRFGLNPQAAFDFLTQGTYGHLRGEGFFGGVSQIPAGHYLTLSPDSEPRIRGYWALPSPAPRDRVPYDDVFRKRFREVFTDAVELRLRADVPVGATLSGGLDSSTIVALMDELTRGAPLHLFTSLYPGSVIDETPYFESVVRRLRRPIVHKAVPSNEGFAERLRVVLHHQEEPFGDTSIFAHYHLMEAAREAGVPVVLSGQGGDELMLGYPSLVKAYLGHLLAQGRVVQAWREMKAWRIGSKRSAREVLPAAALHALPLGLRNRLRGLVVATRLAPVVSPALRSASQLSRFDATSQGSMLDAYLGQVFTRFSIPHLTHYDDRNGMAFAVEGRMPFLDHRVVELLFTVRYEGLLHRGITKRVLREVFADLLPQEVRDRRDKVGFFSPLARWLRNELEWIAAFMTRERMGYVGVLEPSRYLAAMSRFRSGSNAEELEIWRGLVFHLWVDQFEVAPFNSAVPQAANARTSGGFTRPSAVAT